MPKSQAIEEKFIDGIKVDKENDVCFFNDELHAYYDKETMQKYISVTQLIGNYEQKFDEEFWSGYKALEEILPGDIWSVVSPKLMATKRIKPELISKLKVDEKLYLDTQQSIKDEYKRKRDESCERGTSIHLEHELSFYGNENFDLSKYGLNEIKGDYFCKQDYFELDIDKCIYPEYLVSWVSPDGELRISGQIDLLVKNGNELFIVDWKTNKEIKKHSYFDKVKKKHKMMQFPVNNLEDCNWNHYQLQLSCYAWLLQQINPDFVVKRLVIVHIDHNGNENELEVTYLKDDIERLINHYKRQSKIQMELNKNKPIIIE